MTRSILIFSGNNQRAVIAFCRYAKTEQIPFDIIANGSEDPIFQSFYSSCVISVREKNKLDISEILQVCEKIKSHRKAKDVLILPSTEYLNRFLLKYKKIFEVNDIYFGLCNEELYTLISNKHSFSELCKIKNIPVPLEYLDPPKIPPFVVKPKKYGRKPSKLQEKPILVSTILDLEKIKNLDHLTDYYFQHYIIGPSYYLLYYFSKSGDVLAYSQENLIQQDEGGSMILAKSSKIHQNSISTQFIDLFKELGFFGLVMVEVKYDGEKFVMIEANPRLWGPSQLIVDSGMMIFDAFCVDNLLKSDITQRKYQDGVNYFWSGGLISNLKEGKKPKFYQFEESKFYSDYHMLMQHDVYLREDTLTIYFNENS